MATNRTANRVAIPVIAGRIEAAVSRRRRTLHSGLIVTSSDTSAEPMNTDIRVKMIPTHAFEEVPHPFVLLVPGGGLPTLRAMSNEPIRNYVRSAAETAEVAGSICTGALILASVGLLEGRQATTHWAFHKILEQFGATYVRKRWVEDGKLISSAGVSAGIDAALALAARLTDEETARRVQRSLGYDPHPPFGGIDYDHLGTISNTMGAGLSLAAPVIAAKPKRLSKLTGQRPSSFGELSS